MARHTKGPWVIQSGSLTTSVVAPDSEKSIAAIHRRPLSIDEEDVANTNLIAAAPELLAALEGLLADWERVHGTVPADHEAPAAIRRARGDTGEPGPKWSGVTLTRYADSSGSEVK